MGLFQKGNAGKPKGATAKVHATVKEMILTALQDVGGVAYLQEQAIENPVAFLGLVGKVLPLQVEQTNANSTTFVIFSPSAAPNPAEWAKLVQGHVRAEAIPTRIE